MTYPLRMKHPEHGWTHVYSELEEQSHAAHGWLRDEPGGTAPTSEPSASVSEPESAPPAPRRGRPPGSKNKPKVIWQ